MSEDRRLYLAEPGWHPVIGGQILHCHLADAADGFYHRIAAGGVPLSRYRPLLPQLRGSKRIVLTFVR
ncbi:MAG: hypothetical protein U1D30_16045 [Planctomycetota bacterium]